MYTTSLDQAFKQRNMYRQYVQAVVLLHALLNVLTPTEKQGPHQY